MRHDRIRRRLRASLLPFAAAGALLLAVPAGAVVNGPCTGRVEFSNGSVLTAEQPLDPPTLIPPKDEVAWSGSIQASFDEPVPYAGAVQASVGGIMNLQIAAWQGKSDETSASGTYAYQVPAFVPRGTGAILLTGQHAQGDVVCAGQVTLALEGSPGPVAYVSALGTAVFLAGTLAAGVAKGGRG